jgi:hypothetical protein
VLQLNGILAHASNDYINSYVEPKVGADTPIFITEMNCCSIPKNNPFLTYLYNGIFLAEYTARLSAVPNVKAVGINQLYTENNDNHGMIQSMNDFESYLLSQLAADPNYSTNTATDPNTQFVFYTSAPGLAMAVANQAINSGTQIWQTTVTGGRTVAISGFDGNPIPALYAQAYRGKNGRPSLLITNKSAYAQGVTIQVDAVRVNAPLSMTYISSSNAAAANTAQSPNTVQIMTASPANPFNLGPYSVATVTW